MKDWEIIADDIELFSGKLNYRADTRVSSR